MLWAFERACLRRVALVHVLSHFSANQVWKLYAVPRDRIVMIPGAAATERFQPAADRGAVRRQLGIAADRSLLFTVRNLESRMGLDSLLRAMAIVKARRPDALLLIRGTGSLAELLKAQSHALGLEPHVQFLGFVPDEALPRYYQAADAFVLPTRELEGFGLVTVEALACGTPVLGTPVGATPEILAPLCPSLIFGGTAPEMLAAGLERFLDDKTRDPERYERLRAAESSALRAALHVGARDHRPRARAAAAAGRGGNDDDGACRTRPHAATGGRLSRLRRADSSPANLVYRGVRHYRCGGCGSSLATVPAHGPGAPAGIRGGLSAALRAGPPHRGAARASSTRSSTGWRVLASVAIRRDSSTWAAAAAIGRAARARRWLAVNADLPHQACTAARRGGEIPTVQADGALLPFRSGTVDAVTLVNIVDQAREPLTILQEAHRVLRAGGLLALRVPNVRFHRPWDRFLIALGPLARSRTGTPIRSSTTSRSRPRGSAALRSARASAVLEVGNSTVAAREPTTASAATARLPRWGRVAIAASVTALAALSRDRCLVGPSVELYARKGSG